MKTRLFLIGIIVLLLQSNVFAQNAATLEETKEWIVEKANSVITQTKQKVDFSMQFDDPKSASIVYFNTRFSNDGDNFVVVTDFRRTETYGQYNTSGYHYFVREGNFTVKIPWPKLNLFVVSLDKDPSSEFFLNASGSALIITGKQTNYQENATVKTYYYSVVDESIKMIEKNNSFSTYPPGVLYTFATNLSAEEAKTLGVRVGKANKHLASFFKKEEKF